MIKMKQTLLIGFLLLPLAGCAAETPAVSTADKAQAVSAAAVDVAATLLEWEDLMPVGEEALLAELYSDFFETLETSRIANQTSLADAAKLADQDITNIITEGSEQDTMEQIGTFNVVGSLDGEKIRIPGYVVPFDFSAKSEHDEFLLVPYFGACLHTPPPPPNQIIYVKAPDGVTIGDINEPVWLEGTMSTGKFTSDLGNSAYELNLSKLEPYEY